MVKLSDAQIEAAEAREADQLALEVASLGVLEDEDQLLAFDKAVEVAAALGVCRDTVRWGSGTQVRPGGHAHDVVVAQRLHELDFLEALVLAALVHHVKDCDLF